MEISVLNESYAQVTYRSDYKLVNVVWSGNLSTQQYQATYIAILDYQLQNLYEVENFLTDVRNQGIISPDNRKWFESVVLPRAVNQGLKRAAVIFSGNVFKKYYLNLILQTTNKFGLPFKFFDNEETALDWFKSFEKK